MAPPRQDNPLRTLAWASWWLRGLGAVLVVAGAVVLLNSVFAAGDETSRFGRISRGLGGAIGWLIPGLGYLLFSIFIPRRRRWAVTGAEILTYIQMFFAGAMIVVSLLHVRGMWPTLLISLLWIGPLLLTPKFTGPCPRAMDLLVQIPTLGLKENASSRESRRQR